MAITAPFAAPQLRLIPVAITLFVPDDQIGKGNRPVLHWLSRFTRPQSISNNRSQPWQPLLWREWRNCEDEEYARHLFVLLVDEPAGGWAIAVLGLLGTLYGVLGGWLIGLLRCWPEANAGLLSKDILIGTLLGGTAGLLLGLGLRWSGQLTWGAWLQGLIPTVPLIELPQLFPLPLFFRLLASLTSGIGVGITGAVFFGQAHPPFYSFQKATGDLCSAHSV